MVKSPENIVKIIIRYPVVSFIENKILLKDIKTLYFHANYDLVPTIKTVDE